MEKLKFTFRDGRLRINDLNLTLMLLAVIQDLKLLLKIERSGVEIVKEFNYLGIEASEIEEGGKRNVEMIEDCIVGLSTAIDLDFVNLQSTSIYSENLSFEEIKESLESLRDYLHWVQIMIHRDDVEDKELIEKYNREYSEIKKDLEIVQYMIRELLCAPGLFMEGSELANYIFNYPKIMGESIVPYYVIPKPFVPDEDEVQRILDVLKDLDLDDYE